MTGMTDDLVKWLRAQLDEDEQIAREAAEEGDGQWRLATYQDGTTTAWHGEVEVMTSLDGTDAVHIRNWDPARVLAEVDAKRRIMAIHHPRKFEGMGGLPQICDGCGYGGICDDPITEDINDCPILRVLALPYADRPGYHSEWAPTQSDDTSGAQAAGTP